MFFAIQKGETTRVVKAANYNELSLKAVNSFKMNPNRITLTYLDITEEKVTLDSEDTFEYVEQRAQEIKASNSSYKPVIELDGDDSVPEEHVHITDINKELSTSMVSDISRVVKPVPRESVYSESEVIFNDRATEVQQAEDQLAKALDTEESKHAKEEIDQINHEVSQEEVKNSRNSGVIKLATQVPSTNKPQDNDMLSPLVLEPRASAGDAMASPKMSEIGHDNLALPGQPLQSKNTQMMLAEMGEDLAGMGAGGLVFDEGSGAMMRQSTVMANDPAMASVQSKPQPQPQPQVNAQVNQNQPLEDMQIGSNYGAMIAAVNRGSLRPERSNTHVGKSSSQVSGMEPINPSDIDGMSEYAPGLRKETTQMMMAEPDIQRVATGSQETDTDIKRMPTDFAFSEIGQPIQQVSMAAPVIANNQMYAQPSAQNLSVPQQAQKNMDNSFVTDLSMKEYSVYGGKHPNAPSQQLSTKERELTMKLNQFKKMLESLTPVVAQQKLDIKKQQAQIADLIRQNSELKNQQGSSSQSIPCFRCDGRQTEKGRSDPCRRCRGTGRVNTQHEKFLIEMIQSQIEKQIPVAMSQKDLRGQPSTEHPGVTCAICRSSPLQGARYLCLVCDDMNICEQCELESQHSKVHAMAVIREPRLSPDDFIESQAQQAERRQKVRAQEIISESLVRQESVESSNSLYKAKYVNMSLKDNKVFKAGDVIENVWTYKNTGENKILKGVKFVMVAGDQELNMAGIMVQEDVRPNQFFKVRISVKAPAVSKHYSAGFMLIDQQGNYFGDKVVLDVIVEDDCSESVILAEMMDNVDMNLSMQKDNKQDFNAMRNQRMSMMIHRSPQQQQPQAPQPSASAQGMPNQNPPSAWQGMQPMQQMQPQQQPPQMAAASGPQQMNPNMQPHMPQAPMGQQPQMQMQMQAPQAQPQPQMQPPQGWGPPPQSFPPQPPQERSAFDDNSRDSLIQQPKPVQQPPAMMPQNNAGPIPQSWGMPPSQQVPIAQAMPAQAAPAMPAPAMPMGQPAAAPQDFFNQGPMRYPTMSGLKVDAAGVAGAQVEEAKVEPPLNQPKPILKQPTAQPVPPPVEYGNKPPALPKNVGFSEANTYNEKLEQAYPASRNASDASNRQMRETFFLMKDFGYDDFEKNSVVITKFKNEGKLDNIMLIQQQLEAKYNQGNQAAAQPHPAMVPQPLVRPNAQPMMPALPRQDSMVADTKKVAYSEKVNKKLKDPAKTIMLQLMELGYVDYDKNLKVIKKQKKPDISVTLDQLNKA